MYKSDKVHITIRIRSALALPGKRLHPVGIVLLPWLLHPRDELADEECSINPECQSSRVRAPCQRWRRAKVCHSFKVVFKGLEKLDLLWAHHACDKLPYPKGRLRCVSHRSRWIFSRWIRSMESGTLMQEPKPQLPICIVIVISKELHSVKAWDILGNVLWTEKKLRCSHLRCQRPFTQVRRSQSRPIVPSKADSLASRMWCPNTSSLLRTTCILIYLVIWFQV